MHEPTYAPGWRGRPRRFGPIEAADTLTDPAWLVRWRRGCAIGCAVGTAATLAAAAIGELLVRFGWPL